MIHDSFDYPDPNSVRILVDSMKSLLISNISSPQVTKFVRDSSEYLIEIIPEEFYTTDQALELPISERNCLSADEREMFNAVKYSYINCMAECRSKIALENCGCVPYYLPNNGNLEFPHLLLFK